MICYKYIRLCKLESSGTFNIEDTKVTVMSLVISLHKVVQNITYNFLISDPSMAYVLRQLGLQEHVAAFEAHKVSRIDSNLLYLCLIMI